jgi:hypothetical protein
MGTGKPLRSPRRLSPLRGRATPICSPPGKRRRAIGLAPDVATPSGRSIQAKGIEPDIKVLQEVPDDLKARTDAEGEASLHGHLMAEGNEESGSQSYVPRASDLRLQGLRSTGDRGEGSIP